MGSPRGRTLTFVLTDLARSTELWERDPDGMRAAMARHDHLIAAAAERNAGTVLTARGEGDSTFTIFDRSADGVAFALDVQRAFLAEPWGEPGELRVRIGVHTGPRTGPAEDAEGPEVNRCARVRALARPGQVLVTAATAERAAHALPPRASLLDLGSHRLRGISQPERILQLCHPDLPADFPPVRSLSVVPNNLPAPLTSFIGRRTELAALRGRLDEHRLVTIVGVGGAGKTRLALQAAERSLDSFDDGVWFAELAALERDEDVSAQLARALGVRIEPGRPALDEVVRSVGERAVLVVLDNCEHVIDGAAEVAARLVSACPRARVLATSREALRVEGEALIRLDPLPAPDEAEADVARLAGMDAVRLFVERGRLQRPELTLASENAAAIATIVRRLDGIPLALELAAARTGLLSVEQIAARLEDRLAALGQRRRSTPDHHRTLEDSIAWSVDPLSGDERTLFRRLSVFAGGATLAAVEQVCASAPLDEGRIVGTLASLVDRSLVVADGEADQVRYRMLDTIRDFARRMLEASGEASDVAAAHLRWCRALAGGSVTAVLDAERANIAAALGWGTTDGDRDDALAVAAAVWPSWVGAGDFAAARHWLATVLDGAPDGDPDRRAEAMGGLGRVALLEHDLDAAHAWSERALATAVTPEVRQVMLQLSGSVAHARGDLAAARTSLEEAHAVAEKRGDERALAKLAGALGQVMQAAGDLTGAREMYQRSMDGAKGSGDLEGMVHALADLGSVALAQRDFGAAVASFEEAHRLAEQLRDLPLAAQLQAGLAAAALEHGDLDLAERSVNAAIERRRDLGDEVGSAIARMYAAEIARARGDLSSASEHGLAAVATFEEAGFRLALASARSVLGDVAADGGRIADALGHYRAALGTLAAIVADDGVAAVASRIAGVLEGIAACAVGLGEAAGAARLLGASTGLRAGAPAPPSRRRLIERARAGVRTALDADADDLLRAGEAASLDEVLALADTVTA